MDQPANLRQFFHCHLFLRCQVFSLSLQMNFLLWGRLGVEVCIPQPCDYLKRCKFTSFFFQPLFRAAHGRGSHRPLFTRTFKENN
jgi:hypothetical protein